MKEKSTSAIPPGEASQANDCLYSSTTARSTVVWGGDVRSPSLRALDKLHSFVPGNHAVRLQ